MPERLNLYLEADTVRRLDRAVRRMYQDSRSDLLRAAVHEAIRLLEQGEYVPVDEDACCSVNVCVYAGRATVNRLQVLCLSSPLTYRLRDKPKRPLTSAKVTRDVLHCMLNLLERGVQLRIGDRNAR
jgi:hypothetical protein